MINSREYILLRSLLYALLLLIIYFEDDKLLMYKCLVEINYEEYH